MTNDWIRRVVVGGVVVGALSLLYASVSSGLTVGLALAMVMAVAIGVLTVMLLLLHRRGS